MLFVIVGALIIGLSLGLMGSGGSILTVPVLVYLLGHEGKAAIAESLAIVGGIALATMIPYARARLVSWRNVVFFGVPGMAGTYLGAWISRFVPSTAQLILFAGVMLAAAWIMLRPSTAASVDDSALPPQRRDRPKALWLIALEGLLVGIVTGLVGVGGGFLIVPALVIFGKLPMRLAIGTSLAVIAMKSFAGFYKYVDVLRDLNTPIDWRTIALFVLIGMCGSLAGHLIASKLNQRALQRAFAAFLVCMGLFVLGQEGPKMFAAPPPAHAAAAQATPPDGGSIRQITAPNTGKGDHP